MSSVNVLNNVYFLRLMLNVTNDPVRQVTSHFNTSFTRKRVVLVKILNNLSTLAKTHS